MVGKTIEVSTYLFDFLGSLTFKCSVNGCEMLAPCNDTFNFFPVYFRLRWRYRSPVVAGKFRLSSSNERGVTFAKWNFRCVYKVFRWAIGKLDWLELFETMHRSVDFQLTLRSTGLVQFYILRTQAACLLNCVICISQLRLRFRRWLITWEPTTIRDREGVLVQDPLFFQEAIGLNLLSGL